MGETKQTHTLGPFRDAFDALAEYRAVCEEIGQLEELNECGCDPDNFHRCSLCEDVSHKASHARNLMNLWGDQWAMLLDRSTLNSPHTEMLEALQAVLNDMRRMSSPSLLTLGKVISAIQQACEHDWRGVDWGRMCFKCGKEDRQI